MKTSACMVTIFCLLMLLPDTRALAADEVEVTGQAAIFDGDKAQARDKAIDDALRKAVESAVGTMISSETITENYQLLSDRIYSQAEGYVKKYKITDERAEDNVYIVKISAQVATGAISTDIDSLKNVLKRKEMPRVIIMVAEQNVGSNKPVYWWGPGGAVVTQDMRVVENTVMQKMKAKGFTFVDTDVLEGKKSIGVPVAYLSDKQARRIAKTSDAELLIVGKAVARDIGKTWEGTRLRSANAELAVRAINCDNGEIIAVATETATVPNISPTTAGSQALKRAAEKLSDKIIDMIAKKWVSETSGTASIRMTVKGIKNHRMLSEFIKVLSNQVRSVKDVHQKSLRSGTAILQVILAGKTRNMATELEAKDFKGAFKIEVESVKAGAITVRLIK
ncbi:MAG TPA: flagellar assembly protein T N-terminal domain-containing protein [Myxococcota bacterium]|nr:flagellar assembly protein T N-terminal domain-containing protein [Myxococcota bacterium]